MRAFQRRLMTHRMRVLRRSARNVDVFLPVPGCASVPCRRITTSNFDQPRSFAGQLNSDNAITSDRLEFPPGYDVRAEDKIGYDTGDWFTCSGDPEDKERIPRQKCFITIDVGPPRIDETTPWSDL